MTDRRRINGPSKGTSKPVFASSLGPGRLPALQPFKRSRKPKELRKIFLKTGLTPSASGSAYLEIENFTKSDQATSANLASQYSSLKLICTVHGPKPLPRNANFSANLLISTYVKFAPFAARERRGYIRDSRERDLSVHLETALKAVILAERWPKSGLDIVVTVLEAEDDGVQLGNGSDAGGGTSWSMMNVLAGCITAASAALVDARVDCLDLVSGGVAAIATSRNGGSLSTELVLDPHPSEHIKIAAACVVGYTSSSDEITELWVKGDLPGGSHDGRKGKSELLIEGAVEAATAARTVLVEAVKESAEALGKGLIPTETLAVSSKGQKPKEDKKLKDN